MHLALFIIEMRVRAASDFGRVEAFPCTNGSIADGALLVYDITDEASFTRVKDWVKELRKMLSDELCIAIAGNKCDMEKSRQVSSVCHVATRSHTDVVPCTPDTLIRTKCSRTVQAWELLTILRLPSLGQESARRSQN